MNQIKGKLILITGGVRSGKSSFAESLAIKLGKNIGFIATAQPLDEEMATRIAQHRKRRPENWETWEEPYQVERIIEEIGNKTEVIIIDCLTLLVSNLMQDGNEGKSLSALAEKIKEKIRKIIDKSLSCQATVIMVSNEVGLGIVPANVSGRFFRDLLGEANQMVAASSNQVYLMVAGIPLLIKGNNNG